MARGQHREFETILCAYSNNEETRAATNAELLEIVRSGNGWERIRAVELLGVLKVPGSEPTLTDVLDRVLLEPDQDDAAAAGGRAREERFLIVRLLTALLLIDMDRWEARARTTAARFSGSWIEDALLSTLDLLIRKKPDSRGGSAKGGG